MSFADIDFINSKPALTRLGLAAQLKFFSARGFFADDGAAIPIDAAEYLAELSGEMKKLTPRVKSSLRLTRADRCSSRRAIRL